MTTQEQLRISEVLQKLKSNELKCVNLIDQCIRNIEDNSELNAIIYYNKDDIFKHASNTDQDTSNQNFRGRLHGIPIIVKDNIHVHGMPNTAGCPAFKHFVPNEDALVIEKLKNEGALIIAKSNMHELGLGITSNNGEFDPVKNPFNKEYSGGGSSGGTAVAVATKMCIAGLGTDTVGSIRVPSSVNGIYGFRPSTGRYSHEGVTPCAPTLDTVGPMCAHIEDLIYLDEIITGQPFKSEDKVDLKGIKIGIPTFLCKNLDQDVQRAFETVRKQIEAVGCQLVNLDINEIVKSAHLFGMKILYNEPYKCLSEYIKHYKLKTSIPRLIDSISSPDVKHLWVNHIVPESTNSLSVKQYEEIVSGLRKDLISTYIKELNDNYVSALLFPTIPKAPVKIKDLKDEVEYEPVTFQEYIRNTNLSSVLGTPSLNLPSGQVTSDGVPIGLEIDGLPNKDHFVLGLGVEINKIIQENKK